MAMVKGIVTYADDGQGHQGTIYKASGFKLLGMTAPKKDFWVNGKIQQRGKTRGINGEYRDRSRKWLFVKDFRLPNQLLASFDSSVTESCQQLPSKPSELF
jgi:hypothetical protein